MRPKSFSQAVAVIVNFVIYCVVTDMDWLCKHMCKATSRTSVYYVACAAYTAAGGTLVTAAAGSSTAACEPPASDQGASCHQQRGEGGLPSHVPTKDSPWCILSACSCSPAHVLRQPPSLGQQPSHQVVNTWQSFVLIWETWLHCSCNMRPFLRA